MLHSRFALSTLLLVSSVSVVSAVVSLPSCPEDAPFRLVLDFEQFAHGEYVSDLGFGITVNTNGFGGLPRVYDTDTSGGLDPDLEVGIGKCLIIEQDGLSTPNDNVDGGFMRFFFPEDSDYNVYADKITILDAESQGRINFFKDGNKLSKVVDIPPINNAEVEVIQMDLEKDDLIDTIRVRLIESGAICDISVCLPCPPGLKRRVYDFSKDSFGPVDHGDYVSVFDDFTVKLVNPRRGTNLSPLLPRIYDSDLDGGADVDLEVDEGNLLIVQTDLGDDTATTPDDNQWGGTIQFNFNEITHIFSMGLVDFEDQPTRLRARDPEGTSRIVSTPPMADGEFVEWDIPNSINKVGGPYDGPKVLELWSVGSGGIAYLDVCVPFPDVPL